MAVSVSWPALEKVKQNSSMGAGGGGSAGGGCGGVNEGDEKTWRRPPGSVKDGAAVATGFVRFVLDKGCHGGGCVSLPPFRLSRAPIVEAASWTGPHAMQNGGLGLHIPITNSRLQCGCPTNLALTRREASFLEPRNKSPLS
jgi:hypothetical protein